MSETSKLWYLENVDLFKFICPTRVAKVDIKEMQDTFKKGEFIYFPDEPSDELYLIEKGRVKIGAYSEDGKEILKGVLHPGEIFGEMALVGEESRSDFAQAMDEEVVVCHMRLEDIRSLMYEDINFSLKITRLIGLKLQKMERRLESLVFKDARTRIVDFLKDLAFDKGVKVGTETLVRRFLTHKEIANLTGTSRQTVTSVLNELREKNLIYFDRKRLLIRDMETLV